MIARVEDGRVLLDLRTVLPEQDQSLVRLSARSQRRLSAFQAFISPRRPRACAAFFRRFAAGWHCGMESASYPAKTFFL